MRWPSWRNRCSGAGWDLGVFAAEAARTGWRHSIAAAVRSWQREAMCPLAGHLEYARHGRSIWGESPLEEEVVLTPSRRQLRRREAGWEGNRGETLHRGTRIA
jgi:hypothetical protein